MLIKRTSDFGVIASMHGLPEKTDELRRRLRDLTGLTRYVDGCISCELIENGCDSTEFTLLIKWSDEEAHTAHFSTKPIKNAMAFLPILLSDELDLCKRALKLNTVRYGINSYCIPVC